MKKTETLEATLVLPTGDIKQIRDGAKVSYRSQAGPRLRAVAEDALRGIMTRIARTQATDRRRLLNASTQVLRAVIGS